MIASIGIAIFVICMVGALMLDVLTQKIPNWLTLVVAFTFIAILPFSGLGVSTAAVHILAGVLALMLGFALFSLGALGGGDAKLMAVTVPWIGIGMPLMQYFATFALLGALLCLAIMFTRKYVMWERLTSISWVENWICHEKGYVPYGMALGPAGIVGVYQSPIFQNAIASMI